MKKTTIHNRRSIRLKGYDYSREGLYFITICTNNRAHLFGFIYNQQLQLSTIGNIVQKCWEEIPIHFPNVILHEYVIMPNHIHGIVEISSKLTPDNWLMLPHQQHDFQKMIPRSVASIVKGFKIGVTKWCRNNTKINTVWQRNYYEHIIRNEPSYHTITRYIINNPEKWNDDCFFN